MSDQNQLVFAELSIVFRGDIKKHWVVANDRDSIPTTQCDWGFNPALYGIGAGMTIRTMTRFNIEKLGLQYLEQGIDIVESGIEKYYIVRH